MFQEFPKEKKLVSWIFVWGWTLFIYITIPLASVFRKYIHDHFGSQTFGHFVLLTVIIFCAVAVLFNLRKQLKSVRSLIWLAVIAAVYIKYTLDLMKGSPEEAIHFVQYGALGLLIYRALIHTVRDKSIFFIGTVLGSIIGIVDETIQWVIPTRWWDFRDIWLNLLSSFLIQLAIAMVFRPVVVKGKITSASIRKSCAYTAVFFVFLGGTFLNTPQAIKWYSENVPFLEFMKKNKSMMFEYGHLYEDPEIGIFRSRFSPEELKSIDSEEGKDAADTLNKYKHDSLYHFFITEFSPVTGPFLHELRVHIFRRDRFIYYSSRHEKGGRDYQSAVTVAHRENLILEKYFPNTLRQSGFLLPDELKETLKRHSDPEMSYESAVSRNLITQFSGTHVFILLMFCYAVIGYIYMRLRSTDSDSGA